MIARLEVTRGSLTEYPLAEKVCGGWQNGVMFYPDAEVTKVTPLIFRNETPTDDDQDVRAQIVCRALEHQDGGEECEVDFAAADAILAGGFRRSEVPEPSTEGYAEFESWEQEMFRHQPVLSMADGSIAGCQCLDRVFVKGREDWGTHLASIVTSRLSHEQQGEPTEAHRESLIRVIAASASNDQGLKIRDDQRTADAVLAWIEREGA